MVGIDVETSDGKSVNEAHTVEEECSSEDFSRHEAGIISESGLIVGTNGFADGDKHVEDDDILSEDEEDGKLLPGGGFGSGLTDGTNALADGDRCEEDDEGEVVSEDKGWLSGGGFGSGRTGSTNALANGDRCEEGDETEAIGLSGGGFGSGRNGTFPISDVHDSLYECSTVEFLLELISSISSNSLPFPR